MTLAAIEPAFGFDLHSAGILLHILLLTYWLGGDLGVFYASRFITNPDVPVAGRTIAMKIMHMVDLAPRVCLILMLPSGVTLMAATDLGHDVFYGWPLALIWVASLVWLGLMLVDFFKRAEKHADLVHKADGIVRVCLSVGLLAVAAYTMFASEPFGVTTNPKWLAGKVAAYALCIFGGIMIRVALHPFGPAFGKLLTDGSSPDVEAAIGGAMKRAIPWVMLIWAMVLVASFLGVFKPGTLAG